MDVLTPSRRGARWMRLIKPVQTVVDFFAGQSGSPTAAMPAAVTQLPDTFHAAANHRRFAPPKPVAAPRGTLRVLRVVEPGSPAHSAGRMVITGRFADVCAELDRLSRQEAA